MSDILEKLNKFECAVIAAWSYDTKLDHQEDYISAKQIKKSDEYFDVVSQLKKELIEEITNATARKG